MGWIASSRQVRFASQLEPPYSDMDEETYFRKRMRSDSSGNSSTDDSYHRDKLWVCMICAFVCCFVILISMVIYYSLSPKNEK